MCKIVLTLLFITIPIPLFSQTTIQDEISSLRIQLKKKLPTKVRIDKMNELSWCLWKERGLGMSESELLATNALKLSEDNRYPKGIGWACKTLGAHRIHQRAPEKAIEYYRRGVKELGKIEDYEGIGAITLSWGNVLKNQGKFKLAVGKYYEGLEATKYCSCDRLLSSIYTSIAVIKVKQKEFEEAAAYYRKAIKIQRQSSPLTNLAVTYYNYANLLSAINQLDSSLNYFNKAEGIFKANQFVHQLAKVYGAKGHIFLKKNNRPTALKLYEQSLQIKEKRKDAKGLAISYHQFGYALFQAKEYPSAERYLNKCLKIVDTLSLVEVQSKVCKTLSDLYNEIGEPKNEVFFFRRYIALRDSINNPKTAAAIKEIEEKYKNVQLEAALKRNEIIRNSTLLILCIVLFFMGLIIYYYQQKRKSSLLISAQKEALHLKEVERLKQESALQSLNAIQDGQEIERKRIAEALHNSMGSLLSAIQMQLQSLQISNKQAINKTLNLLSEAASTNRRIAHEMMPPILMRFGLKAALDHIADKLRSPDMKVNTSVYGTEDRYPDKLELALYRIIDELLNNILKHAKATEVNIQLTEHDNWLNILVEDNGKGFSYRPEAIDQGMGLNNIQARVNHFKGQLSIDSSLGRGTTISIDIPFTGFK